MKYIIALLLTLFVHTVQAIGIARSPNTGGGFIVLTDEPCIYKNKDYAPLKRAYSYTAKGHTFEGCYGVEDDTVLVIYLDDKDQRRYPLSGFELINRGGRI
jgi:hypothetical protein